MQRLKWSFRAAQPPGTPPRTPPTSAQTRHWLMILLAVLFLTLGFWVTLILRPDDASGRIEVGKPSPMNIRAERSVDFVSELLTEQARTRAENNAPVVYETDRARPAQQREQLVTLLNTITSIRTNPSLGGASKLDELRTLPASSLVISDTLAEAILDLNDSAWSRVVIESNELFDRALTTYDSQLDQATVQRLRQEQLPAWASSSLSQPQRDMVLLFTTSFLVANHAVDEEATARNREEARESVQPVVVTVQEGENIVRVGEIVTPLMIETLQATGMLPEQLNLLDMSGLAVIAALLASTLVLYLLVFHRDVAGDTRPLMVIVGILVLTALAARFWISNWDTYAYTFPLAAASLVLTVVFNSRLAMGCTVVLCAVVGLIPPDTNLPLAITLLLGSIASIIAARGADRLLLILLAGLAAALMTALSQVGFWFITTLEPRPEGMLPILFFSITNGAVSSMIAWGMFAVVASISGVVTAPQLMELSHPSRPLLRKLMREAPGTYYHSVSVGNLAEAAAEAVEADALLLRVAAYYHDIGKMIRPYFFTDNQTGRENVHNELDPQTSAAIIIDHVREGVKMGRANGLPQRIIDFIATHHGTHVVTHFYQLALRQQDTVNIEEFRYPGPRPFTREQGILMLADSVEATVRAKAQHGGLRASRAHSNGAGESSQSQPRGGGQTIEELVSSIIDERVRGGQLDNTALTLRDLVLIRAAFISTLQGIYHPRTEYAPQLVKT